MDVPKEVGANEGEFEFARYFHRSGSRKRWWGERAAGKSKGGRLVPRAPKYWKLPQLLYGGIVFIVHW